jgi:hypothetical protein
MIDYKKMWIELRAWCEEAEAGHHGYGKDYTQAFSNICKKMDNLEEGTSER